ncbi:hypothetical protein BZM27_32955 [Paraburkholderia steynii]|uniref:Uncharacterized protein n=1 Tax=Paraburkholderia steynii TaxID=1245441 RepID=A0A4R0XEL7_9BURK|nr:hypothetical protein BZM27_32955 [Paraburkholderia steynii]
MRRRWKRDARCRLREKLPTRASRARRQTVRCPDLDIRPDGRSQWAFQGKRLYRGLMDKKPGDRAGDGLNEVRRSVRVR